MTARRPVQGAPFEPIAADDAQEQQPRSKSRLGKEFPFIWDPWGGLAISWLGLFSVLPKILAPDPQVRGSSLGAHTGEALGKNFEIR